MPRSSTGKWVARAGATGGGRTYRGQAPVNWYAALVVIVLLGLASVAFARYEYQAGPTKNTTAPVKTGSPWYAAAVFDICGTQKVLPADVADTSTQSFYTSGNGVITIAPKSTKVAGANATFGKFLSSYKGLTVTSTAITLPTTANGAAKSTSTKTTKTKSTKKAKTKSAKTTKTKSTTPAATSKTYRNGGTCAKGTKYAGRKANVEITYWSSAFATKKKPVVYTGDPATLRFTDDQLITIGFVPVGTKLPKPNGTVVTALLDAAAGASSSTTSATLPTTSTPATTTPATTTPATTTPATTSTTTKSTTSTSG